MNKDLPIITKFRFHNLKIIIKQIVLLYSLVFCIFIITSNLSIVVIFWILLILILLGLIFLRRCYLKEAKELWDNLSLTKEQYQKIKNNVLIANMEHKFWHWAVIGLIWITNLIFLFLCYGTILFYTAFPLALFSTGIFFATYFVEIIDNKNLIKNYIDKYRELDS